jgi:Aconitase C-terminal domain
MVRGTLASVRIRNRLAPGTEGGVTTHLPSGEVATIHDVAGRSRRDGTSLLVLAGKGYGSGSVGRRGPARPIAPTSSLPGHDALVDDGSAESFPASDPPAY